MKELLLILLGFVAGSASGLFGIGGGVILIPALVLLAGYTQHEAQGTTLAVFLLPVAIGAAMRYYKSGHVHVSVALLICLGFVFGSFLGASFAESLSSVVLRKAFGAFLLVVSVYMIFGKVQI